MTATKTETKQEKKTALPAETLPKTEVKSAPTKKADKKQRVIICNPETVYHLTVGVGDTAKQIPFKLPPSCKEPTNVTIASANPNWLGQDGAELRAHICSSENGVVILQPHGIGWKANAFAIGKITIG